ncbi:MAG: putative CocE/NonD family hydrolase [Planctomycetota bacterium]|jgi:putative CocE/NonD family hydrolase
MPLSILELTAAQRRRSSALRTILITASCLTALVSGATAQHPSGYTATEVMIPMRDGTKLYTQIFRPVDSDEPAPILLTRTPYGIGGVPMRIDRSAMGPSPAFADTGYIFVKQDVRGQFRSEGEWDLMMPPRLDRTDPTATDESTDAFDTVDWLVENVEGNNGRVGMWGISYDGWQTVMAMADAHPALLAVSPQASPGDEYLGDDTHHYGAFRLAYTFAWLGYMAAERGDADKNAIGPVLTEDGFEFFSKAGSMGDLQERFFGDRVPEWNDIMTHGDYDEYWQVRNVIPQLKQVRPAVLNVAGWFDAEDFRGPIDIYKAVESTASAQHNWLVVGPWKHGGWSTPGDGAGQSLGDLNFAEATAERFQYDIELPFFEHYLRDEFDPLFPEMLAFETGVNEWHELDQWPPAGAKEHSLYLHADGKALFSAPAPEGGFSEFISDPMKPVPYTAAGTVFPSPEYMVEDQRFIDGRADVLSFLGDALEQELTVVGRPLIQLQFSTTGTDADWIVKLIDVYPEDSEEVSAATGKTMAGAKIVISADIFRAKYRESLSTPIALVPGQLTELSFELPDRFHCFRKGHRLLVQVQSTWFPMYDRNPQVFTDIYACDEDHFQRATHRVYHDRSAASHLKLKVYED